MAVQLKFIPLFGQLLNQLFSFAISMREQHITNFSVCVDSIQLFPSFLGVYESFRQSTSIDLATIVFK